MTQTTKRPDIQFVPLSTDVGKIRFFGTLMPALLLLKASPWRFLRFQIAAWHTPKIDVQEHVISGADDAGRVGDTLVFLHRWDSADFDPFAFARAKLFLRRVTRLVRRAGYQATPLDPLSPDLNLPRVAADAGLGDLSPYGLLVHRAFGPRLVLTGLRTNHPLAPTPRWSQQSCTDCLTCIDECPQEPAEGGIVHLGECQSCARCLVLCPVGERASSAA